MRIRFRKLFEFVPDMGYASNAIVVLERIERGARTMVLNDEERRQKGYAVEHVVLQYRYRLYIDLWLAIFRFEWNWPEPRGGKLKE